MPEQDALTIEMEPVLGGQEFGPAQPEPQEVRGVTDEQMQLATQFEQRYGTTATVTAKEALGVDPSRAELIDSTNEFLQRAADRADDERAEDAKTAYNLVTTNAQGIEQRGIIEAASLTEAIHEAWRFVGQEDQKGEPVKRAQLEWDGGNEVTYFYDRDQGFEVDRPAGVVLSHEAQLSRERQPPNVNQSWLEKEAQLIRESSAVAGRIATEDIPLAEAYYSGRRDAFNSAREDFIQHNPELAATVPPAIETHEIRIQQPAIESENLSLEFA